MKFSRHALPNASAARACVLFPGALGDFVCFLPALHQLAQQSPLDLFARREYADLVPPAIRVRSNESAHIAGLFVEGGVDERDLRQFFSAYRNIYSWMGSGVAVFVRQLEQVAPEGAFIFPFRPLDLAQHQMDHYLSCIGAYSSQTQGASVVPLMPQALAWCDEFAERHRLCDTPVLVMAPGSGAVEKNWPMSGFRQVAQWWRREKHGKVLALIGPVEVERGGGEDLESETLSIRDLTLAQCAALLSRCQLYLGNDSGMTHLAAAVGAPTMALFGPSNQTQWSPRGRSVTVISSSLACSPCTTAVMKSCLHRNCLATLSADSVIRQLEQIPEVVTLTRWGAGIRV